MAQKDYYETLGVSKSATDDEIKKAYRTLAKKYHPDINHDKDAPEKFKEVQEAYDCLSDPQKRQYYDQYGTADPNQGGFGGFGGGGFEGFSSNFGDLGDIFSSFFGGGGSRSQKNGPIRGEDVQKRMSVSLEDVIFGKKTEINVPVFDTCPKCKGKGALSDSDIVTCPKCNGKGSKIETVQSLFGTTRTQRICGDCNGTGKYIKNKCPECRGEGKVKINKTVQVDVPIGISTGQQIRFSGFGQKGYNGGENGDLYLQFIVKDNNRYERDGDNLICTEKINFYEAGCGITKDIETPYGPEKLTIPEGTQTGTVLKIRGKGVPNVRTKVKGDLFVNLIVETPKYLNQEQKELLKQIYNIQDNKKSSIFKKK